MTNLDTIMESLETLRLPELQAKYEEVVGTKTRAPNKTFLKRKIREALEARDQDEVDRTGQDMEVVDANGGYINTLGTSEWGSVEKGVKQAIFWSRAYANATDTSTTLRWRDDKEVIDRYTPTEEDVRRVAEEYKRIWRWA